MKYVKYLIFVFIIVTNDLFSQQLPLKIGNEWHYTYGLGLVEAPFIATAVDTLRIKNKLYYKIERWDTIAKEVTRITYDRIEGDSLYYRIYGDSSELVFNFNWQDREIVSSPNFNDSTCTDLKRIMRDTVNIWGIATDAYLIFYGSHCPGMPDTGWTLSGFQYLKYFGCFNAMDGALIGAKIDGIIYGNLHPTPVELLSFSKTTASNSVYLKWSTATETNNYGFEVLRNDSSIGFVRGNGTTTQRKDYEFLDNDLNEGDYKYKLIQIDYDGTRRNIADAKVSISITRQYSLSQNYPNPFNPATMIFFQIPKESYVYIKVFDCLGNEIKTLVSENKKEGAYSVKFDAAKLADGIYFYQMSAGDFISTKKMLFLK